MDIFHPVVLFHTTGWKKSMRVKDALKNSEYP